MKRRASPAVACALAWTSVFAVLVGGCRACTSSSDAPRLGAEGELAVTEESPAESERAPFVATAEVLPRCRASGAPLEVGPADTVFGAAALSRDALALGLVRTVEGKRVAAVARLGRGQTSPRVVDLGPSLGDDPPPLPHWRAEPDGALMVSVVRRKENPAALPRVTRELRVGTVGAEGGFDVVATQLQQMDESPAYDLSWPLVAWDEDAPIPLGKLLPERGVIKVQVLPSGAPRVVSPASSDAEAPRLFARRGGGYWLAWLARRAEVEDAGWQIEAAGDTRAFRWVEAVALDASGAPTSGVRRLTSPAAHAVSFELVSVDPELTLLVQDEGEAAEGAGARLLRATPEGDRGAWTDVLDAGAGARGSVGAGSALASLVLGADGGGWLAFRDPSDRPWIAPATRAGTLAAAPTLEEPLERLRVVAVGDDGLLYAVGQGSIQRLACTAAR